MFPRRSFRCLRRRRRMDDCDKRPKSQVAALSATFQDPGEEWGGGKKDAAGFLESFKSFSIKWFDRWIPLVSWYRWRSRYVEAEALMDDKGPTDNNVIIQPAVSKTRKNSHTTRTGAALKMLWKC